MANNETKTRLLETLAGQNRGLLSTPAQRDLILEQVAQLERRNPTRNATRATSLLEGNWRLLYTTSSELLSSDRLPLVQLGQVYQCIRTRSGQVFNIAELKASPLPGGLISVVARFEVTNNQRLTVGFERFVVGLRTLLGYQDPSQWIEELGRDRRFLGLDLRLKSGDRQGWIDVTYLDENLRIVRGNEGSVFVLSKN
ncbi:PAP/fibrillin family protein [Prochlorothrix hollandica]|uniref:Fibrillin n=1 Tax=Prochlorothrix hollandica PCC 9006 = CALU 1027 TaxID=317619 RepID=A0A0M2PUX0_PROHO|nr:PAP/fibrillin family protein [Prochlorothrix hollandica]KKI99914.1 fibrillin [Prochlorothrix hollandica PCC 9006 = CALU 1027]